MNTLANIVGLVIMCFLFFILGMFQEFRATRLKECEPIWDRVAYEECLDRREKWRSRCILSTTRTAST